MFIHERVLSGIVAHANEEAPNECCGLLLGAGTTIDECVRATNLDHSPTSYLLDPAQHFETLRRVRKEGREVLGAYHSHTKSPPVPSPADIAEAWSPDFVHVIVSLQQARPEIRGYQIVDGNFTEIPFVTVPASLNLPES